MRSSKDIEKLSTFLKSPVFWGEIAVSLQSGFASKTRLSQRGVKPFLSKSHTRSAQSVSMAVHFPVNFSACSSLHPTNQPTDQPIDQPTSSLSIHILPHSFIHPSINLSVFVGWFCLPHLHLLLHF